MEKDVFDYVGTRVQFSPLPPIKKPLKKAVFLLMEQVRQAARALYPGTPEKFLLFGESDVPSYKRNRTLIVRSSIIDENGAFLATSTNKKPLKTGSSIGIFR